MSSHFISSLSRLLFFHFRRYQYSVLFYYITYANYAREQTRTRFFFCNKNPIPNQVTNNNEWDCQWISDTQFRFSNAIHTAVSRYQHVSWTDNQSKSDIPITGNQKTICWACVNILFIFVLKAIFNPIKNVFKPNKGKNRLINLMQHWRMHWSASMVEFPVELSLITLRKPKMSGKNVGWRQNLGLWNRFKKVQNLFCRTNRTLNLTLKFGAKKVRLVRDRIR